MLKFPLQPRGIMLSSSSNGKPTKYICPKICAKAGDWNNLVFLQLEKFGGMHGCLESLVIMLLVYLSKLMAGRLFTLREDMPTKHTFVQFRDVSVRAC